MNLVRNTFIASALAIAFSAPLAEAQPAPIENAERMSGKLNVAVEGMVCEVCARTVTKVFTDHKAVNTVNVDIDSGTIEVELNPCSVLSDEDAAMLVAKAGYTFVSVERT